ncbi:carboxypeptidase-like regulatory domain-containing protein [Aquimarina sp. LLG6339-5]|uniref:carboxypeptidase-like regulatory domain-containing protein n=1 Tax=Aquimarina sp. LLG6339-5 TaxID=3160830 RepID=UPI003863095E
MKIKSLFLFFFLFCFFNATAQYSIKGLVRDAVDGSSLININVILQDTISSALIAYTYTDNGGNFTLETEQSGAYNLQFSALGYKQKIIPITIEEGSNLTLDVKMIAEPLSLGEVVIKTERAITLKKDTVVFNVASFAKGNESVVEDILRTIPGLNIDPEGTIRVGSREVEKVMIEGDDFFEKGYKILTKNMPANPIEKVELLQHYSHNRLLKNIEESDKVALNLKLSEEAKRKWFGNTALGYGLASENRYEVQSNIMNFGKKDKYYFLGNLNNTGYDVTQDLQYLIDPTAQNESSSIGDYQQINSVFNFTGDILNFKKERTNFNNDELLSVNTIFNPTKKLKIKTIGFLNWSTHDFFRNSAETFTANTTNFTNTEDFVLQSDKKLGFAKTHITYDITKNRTLQYIARYSDKDQSDASDLVFNQNTTLQHLQSDRQLLDQKVVFSNKFGKKDILLLTSRYIDEKLSQEYAVDKFLFSDLFSSSDNIDNVTQMSTSKMQFAGIEAHLLQRKPNNNLLEVKLGNKYRRDQLKSALLLQEQSIVRLTPEEYQNDIVYRTNNLYLGTKYRAEIGNIGLMGKLNLHQLFNHIETTSLSKYQSPFFINPSISFDWQINKNNKITSLYAYNTTNADVIQTYDRFLLTGFRTFSRGTGEFNQLNASIFSFNYNLGNWGDRFFANTFILYTKNHDFFSNNTLITQNFNQSTKVLIKNREQLTINTNIDRYFRLISSNLKLNLGYSGSNYKNIINDSDLREVTSRSYTYGLELRSGFKGFFNYHIGSKWTTNSIQVQTTNSFTDNLSFIDLSFVFNDRIDIEFKGERYFFSNLDTNNNTYNFLDVDARYSIKKNTLMLSLKGKNLLNTKNFTNFSLSDTGKSTIQYRLLPRYILLQLEFRF